MKIAVIGASGHYHYIIPSVQKNGHEIAVYLPDKFENSRGLISCLESGAIKYKIFSDQRELLCEKPDIAVINTIFHKNGMLAAEYLSQGIHVFCEKPLAVDYRTLEHLKDTYSAVNKNSRVHLSGMFGLRYHPVMSAVKHAVDCGLAGNIVLINTQKSYKMGIRPAFYGKRETYGGLIPWVAIHAIDWIYWLTGKRFLSVSSAVTRLCNNNNGDMETAGLCVFTLENGMIASVTADMMRPQAAATHGDDRIRITGDLGVIEAADERVIFTGKNNTVTELPLRNEGDIFEEFCNVCQNKSIPTLTAESSLYVTEIALAARESADTGKAIYF